MCAGAHNRLRERLSPEENLRPIESKKPEDPENDADSPFYLHTGSENSRYHSGVKTPKDQSEKRDVRQTYPMLSAAAKNAPFPRKKIPGARQSCGHKWERLRSG